MTCLKIFQETKPKQAIEEHSDLAGVQAALAKIGVKFERWQTNVEASFLTQPDDILRAYEKDIARLKEERGFLTADVIAISSETPNHPELRKKFLREHTHSDDEARFFVAGRGLFYIHAGDQVYSILCESEDLINVPAGAMHWFDMGSNPFFQCVRVFTNQEGWVAEYTGSDIADRFPLLD